MSAQSTSITFFGATGGCTLSALADAIKAGYTVNALVRTPSKLQDLLKARGVDESQLAKLHIVKGNAKDQTAVREALVRPGTANTPVDIVISGLGPTPKFQWSLFTPITLDDKTLCEDCMKTILAALSSFPAGEPKPFLAIVSTTGISNTRDVPLLFVPLYHWGLAVPHKDKKIQERLLDETLTKGNDSPLSGFASVRASLLTDGKLVPVSQLRCGWEPSPSNKTTEQAPGPAIGYTISRESVGRWIYENMIENSERKSWAGKMVSITA